MKQIAFLLIVIAFRAGAFAQASPQHSQPGQSQATLADHPTAAASSPMWDSIEHLPRGEKIKISYGRGSWEHCRFAGATDAYLYCDSEDFDRVQIRQIDRVAISDFKFDHDARNGRLIVTGMAVVGGISLGFINQKARTDPEAAGTLGALGGTALGALAGIPISCLSGYCVSLPDLSSTQPMVYGFSYNVPLRPKPSRSRRR